MRVTHTTIDPFIIGSNGQIGKIVRRAQRLSQKKFKPD